MSDPIPSKPLHPERLLDLSSGMHIDPLLLDLTPTTESEVEIPPPFQPASDPESPENNSFVTGGQESKP
jgi:hypothetical protein